jgi:hypothetical protein
LKPGMQTFLLAASLAMSFLSVLLPRKCTSFCQASSDSHRMFTLLSKCNKTWSALLDHAIVKKDLR